MAKSLEEVLCPRLMISRPLHYCSKIISEANILSEQIKLAKMNINIVGVSTLLFLSFPIEFSPLTVFRGAD